MESFACFGILISMDTNPELGKVVHIHIFHFSIGMTTLHSFDLNWNPKFIYLSRPTFTNQFSTINLLALLTLPLTYHNPTTLPILACIWFKQTCCSLCTLVWKTLWLIYLLFLLQRTILDQMTQRKASKTNIKEVEIKRLENMDSSWQSLRLSKGRFHLRSVSTSIWSHWSCLFCPQRTFVRKVSQLSQISMHTRQYSGICKTSIKRGYHCQEAYSGQKRRKIIPPRLDISCGLCSHPNPIQ